MGFEKVGVAWTHDEFKKELSKTRKPSWCKAITLHHTGSPSLVDRPKGFTPQHIINIRDFYINDRNWGAGPHFFIDDNSKIFGMSDYRKPGIHAESFNDFSIGIEVLGNYDSEISTSGRGLRCWRNAAVIVNILLNWLDIEPSDSTILFHRDDGRTRKKCPGREVDKQWFISLVNNNDIDEDKIPDKPNVDIEWTKWDFRGERWCVPVYDFLVAKGISSSDIYKNLKSEYGKFYYESELIEGAYYIGVYSQLEPNECTWAPVKELMDIITLNSSPIANINTAVWEMSERASLHLISARMATGNIIR